METLFAGIPLDRGHDLDDRQLHGERPPRDVLRRGGAPAACRSTALGGTIQNDMLKEFIAQKEWISPPEPSVRVIVDMIEFCAAHAPRWHPVSISGYHIREAGSTAVQELAFTLADGIGYVEAARRARPRRRRASRRASRSSSTSTTTSSRRSPSSAPRAACGRGSCASASAPTKPRSLAAAHARADGGLLAHRAAAAQQRRPRRDPGARRRARRHAVAAHQLDGRDAGAADRAGGDGRAAHPADHRRGDRRHQHRRSARRQLRRSRRSPIASRTRRPSTSGRSTRWAASIRAIELGFPQKEIAEAAYHYQRQLDRGEKVIVGVNKYQRDDEPPLEILRIDPEIEERQTSARASVKQARDQARVRASASPRCARRAATAPT